MPQVKWHKARKVRFAELMENIRIMSKYAMALSAVVYTTNQQHIRFSSIE